MTAAYDAIIIGTGQAGPSLAGRLAKAGMKVAIVERKLFGGTCVNTGCIPTKTMVASAYAAHMVSRAADFGVETGGGWTVDMRRVKARKDAISEKSRTSVESWLKHMDNCTVYEGQARFESPKEVSVGPTRLSSNRIFINVGGRAVVPEMPGLDQVAYLTNSSMMQVDFLPEHLIIVGGSYVGLEFGQMFRRFGSQVTILEMGPRLVHREDEDISAAIHDILAAEGDRHPPERQVHRLFEARRGHRRARGLRRRLARDQRLACAAGRGQAPEYRRPWSGSGRRGGGRARHTSLVDDQLRTSAPGIWALGDCNGKGGFTHTSYNDFEIVAANLLDNDPRRVSDRILAYGLYIDPPLGRAGMTEAEVRQSGRRALMGQRPMTKVGRAVEKGESQGFMKILVDAESKLILGAAILGTGGDEAIHSILDVMYAKAPYTTIQRAVHIHPTVSELIPTMLGDLQPLVEAGK